MHDHYRTRGLVALWLLLLPVTWASDLRAGQAEVTNIGDRRELFVDRQLIEKLDRVELRLHPPVRAETVLRFDRPWEGPTCAYVTVFRDDDRFRMYYRGSGNQGSPEVTCYAESTDGIAWTKPGLGLFEWNGSTDNNIVWQAGYGSHNFTPFKDARPGVPDDERYKALGSAARGTRGLIAFVSPDGLRWKPLRDEPVLTKGRFDSQNLAFWDENRGRYVSYYRIFTGGVRAIARAESDDFLTWTDPEPIELDEPAEHFYTNATTPYFRAPHYYFAFPKRFVPGRQRLAEHGTAGISDAVFLSSRDGLAFDRAFREALLRPGPDERNWSDRSTMPAWGLVPTGDGEMSIYFSQHYRFDTHHLRRGVFRVDGIASARAGAESGELITRPIRFEGERLLLNYATSAAGSVQVEIQTPDGQPIDGFSLADAPPLYGDAIDEAYAWKSGGDVSQLAGRPVRLRFVLKDGDLFAYRFADEGGPVSSDLRPVIDRLARPFLEQQRAVGIVVGVLTPDGRCVAGYGRVAADREQIPDGDTLFEIGSITKVFTGICLARMCQDGRVALHDRIAEHLPPSVKLRGDSARNVTLRHLATHTSGLPRIPLALVFLDHRDPYARFNEDMLIQMLNGYEWPDDAGTRRSYSNLGMGLLGWLLARRAETSYEELVIRSLCDPLGLADTRITLNADQQRRLAAGHTPEGEPAGNWHFDVLAGAGAFRSTANDMLRFAAAGLNPAPHAGPLADALTHSQQPHADADEGDRPGLGWIMRDSADRGAGGGHRVLWHNGGTGGYASSLALVPARGVAVVVLTNTALSEQGHVADELGSKLLEQLSGGK